MEILILNDTNLNLSGQRKRGSSGSETLDEINERLRQRAVQNGVEPRRLDLLRLRSAGGAHSD